MSKKKSESLGGSFLSLASSKFIKYGFILLSSMLLTRFRTLREYGTYSQITLVVQLATSIFMLGLPNSLNYFLARCDTLEEKNRFVSLYYTVNTMLSVFVGTLLVLLTPALVRYFKNPLLTSFLFFIAVYPWTKIIISSVENLLVVFHRTRLLIAYRISNSLLTVLAILFVKWTGLGFREYLALFLGIEVFFALLVYYFARMNVGRLHFFFDKAMLLTILKFSLPLGLASAVGVLRMEMDKLFIGFVTDTESLALYASAAKEMPVTMISASFTAILLPHISRLMKENKLSESVKLWKDVTVLSFIINCFFALGLFVFSREAVLFLFGRKYTEAAPVFAVYSLTYILRATYFGMILNTGGNTRTILNSSFLSLGVNAVLNVVLYYTVGFTGPAIATVLSTLCGALYLLRSTSRVTGLPFRELYPWKQSGIVLGVNAVLAFAFSRLFPLIPFPSMDWQVAGAIAAAAIWFGLDALIFRKTIREKWKLLR